MNNKSIVPEAREGLNRFKMEAANEVGVTLKQGYNGDLTSRQAGSIGGQIWVNISANLIGYRLIISPYSSSGFLSNTFVLSANPSSPTKKFSSL